MGLNDLAPCGPPDMLAPPPSSCLACPFSGWYFPRAQLCLPLTSLSHSTCSLCPLGPVLRGTLSTDLEPAAGSLFGAW